MGDVVLDSSKSSTDLIQFDILNLIPGGLKYNLFHMGGHICTPMISKKKSFWSNSFCTPKELPHIGLNKKKLSLYLQKQEK